MSNNQNLLGGGKKAGAISLNMSGQTTPMPQTSSLEEKTKAFKFELPKTAKNMKPNSTMQFKVDDVIMDEKGNVKVITEEVQSDETRLETLGQQETKESQIETTTQTPALDKYQHADQPENAEPDATQMFKENLALLEASFGSDKEAVAANVRNCMVYLQDHPELRDILQPEDVQKMVRGLRTSYSGIASSKRNKTKKKVQTSKEVDEMVDLLSGFDLKI